MGLIVSRKSAKNLVVRRENWQILTVSRRKVNRKFFSDLRCVILKVSKSLNVMCLVLRLICYSISINLCGRDQDTYYLG